jgi:RNA polymerase sigma-70 factor (ECF subfamily)
MHSLTLSAKLEGYVLIKHDLHYSLDSKGNLILVKSTPGCNNIPSPDTDVASIKKSRDMELINPTSLALGSEREMKQDLVMEEFIHLVQEHQGVIHKVVNLYADKHDDRQDLRQEILCQAWTAYPRFRGDAKFSTWLYRISLNTALTFLKKDKKNTHSDIIPDVPEQVRRNLDDVEQLRWAIRQLDVVDRLLINLHLEGYSNEEIANFSGLSDVNVRVKLHRIKQKIQEQMKKN